MLRSLLLALLLLSGIILPGGSLAFAMPASGILHVVRQGEIIVAAAKLSPETDIIYRFRRCMANELYTFHRVGIIANSDSLPDASTAADATWVNIADSDNIGPYDVRYGNWTGGNHLVDGAKTARTESIEAFVDDETVADNADFYCVALDIHVVNTVFDPRDASLAKPLVTEDVVYTVSGNSITVDMTQTFLADVELNQYYGMQSVFVGETEIYTPSGKYAAWTPQSQVEAFTKGAFPEFNRYLERNASGTVQSAWLLPVSDYSAHGHLYDSAPVFQRSSYKCYHVLNKSIVRREGDQLRWSGIYSWSNRETALHDADGAFAYEIRTADATFVCADFSGPAVIELPDAYAGCAFSETERHGDISLVADSLGINISADAPASIILRFATERPPIGGITPPDSIRTLPTVYNISGIRLASPQKGINIINGKKVLVR